LKSFIIFVQIPAGLAAALTKSGIATGLISTGLIS